MYRFKHNPFIFSFRTPCPHIAKLTYLATAAAADLATLYTIRREPEETAENSSRYNAPQLLLIPRCVVYTEVRYLSACTKVVSEKTAFFSLVTKSKC